MLSQTSTEWAPWYVIPADRKWFARIGVGAVLVHTLMVIDPRFPAVTKEQRETLREAKEMLEAQAPEGAHADPFEHEQRAERAAASDSRNGHESEHQVVAPADGSTSE